MTPYKQSVYETCFAVCLMHLSGIVPNRKKEIDIWKHGWDFNFLQGQLDYAAKKYKKNFSLIVENSHYAKKLSKVVSKNVSIFSESINDTLLKDMVCRGPVILYIDNFYLHKILHCPHFIVVTRWEGGSFSIIDSWDGMIKRVEEKIMNKAIISLKKYLGFSPLVITGQHSHDEEINCSNCRSILKTNATWSIISKVTKPTNTYHYVAFCR